MKKIFSYAIVMLSVLLLAGCSNQVVVNDKQVLKFDGGSVSKTEAYNQMIATANYDKTYKLVKTLLTKVDMQLLAKDTNYTSKVNEEKVNQQYTKLVEQLGGADKLFTAMTQQLIISVTNEQEAKNAIRYQLLVEQAVSDRAIKEEDIQKAYEQQYGEKMGMRYIVMEDKGKASELQKELADGTVKIEDLVAQYNEFMKVNQQAQTQGQTAPKFTFKDKYVISTTQSDNESPVVRKLGLFNAEDENKLFNRENKDKWMGPIELLNPSGSTSTTKQYLVAQPYQYVDAAKKYDEVKEEIRSTITQTKLQSANEIEKVLREYRKEKGFEITDPELKKAFDLYEKSVDTPETKQNGIG